MRLKKITKFKQIKKMKVDDEVILVRPPVVLKVAEQSWDRGNVFLTGENEVYDQEELDTDLAAGYVYYRVK